MATLKEKIEAQRKGKEKGKSKLQELLAQRKGTKPEEKTEIDPVEDLAKTIQDIRGKRKLRGDSDDKIETSEPETKDDVTKLLKELLVEIKSVKETEPEKTEPPKEDKTETTEPEDRTKTEEPETKTEPEPEKSVEDRLVELLEKEGGKEVIEKFLSDLKKKEPVETDGTGGDDSTVDESKILRETLENAKKSHDKKIGLLMTQERLSGICKALRVPVQNIGLITKLIDIESLNGKNDDEITEIIRNLTAENPALKISNQVPKVSGGSDTIPRKDYTKLSFKDRAKALREELPKL